MAKIMAGNILARLTVRGPLTQTRLSDLVVVIGDVVRDGDLDAEDFPRVVQAVKDVLQQVIPLINIPGVPGPLEGLAIDSWLVPLAQSYADELVRGLYHLLHIPLPESM